MSIVNFSISPTLAKRISRTIKERGFSSKAEFFRFAVIHFMDIVEKPTEIDEDLRFEILTKKLDLLLSKKLKNKKLPSLEDQLKDI